MEKLENLLRQEDERRNNLDIERSEHVSAAVEATRKEIRKAFENLGHIRAKIKSST